MTETPVANDAEPTLEELQARVSERGRSLAGAVDALRGEVREARDWRTHAGRHPYWALSAAAVAGLLSASLLRRRPDPQAQMLQAAAHGLEGLAGRLRGQGGALRPHRMGGSPSLIRGVVGALATRVLRYQLGRRLEALGGPDLLRPWERAKGRS